MIEPDDLPIIGTHAGPQVVVTRLRPDAEEAIFRTPGFEAAAGRWREGRRALQAGGYCVWINDGDVWRASGLLEEMGRAGEIRDRVVREGGGE